MKITPINSILAKNLRYFKIFIIDGKYKIIKISLNLFNSLILKNIVVSKHYSFWDWQRQSFLIEIRR